MLWILLASFSRMAFTSKSLVFPPLVASEGWLCSAPWRKPCVSDTASYVNPARSVDSANVPIAPARVGHGSELTHPYRRQTKWCLILISYVVSKEGYCTHYQLMPARLRS
jgi:hypothetical protein